MDTAGLKLMDDGEESFKDALTKTTKIGASTEDEEYKFAMNGKRSQALLKTWDFLMPKKHLIELM